MGLSLVMIFSRLCSLILNLFDDMNVIGQLLWFFQLREGTLVKCEVYGEIEVNSQLSGIPDLTLSFANPSILNDVQFHPCVRLRPWESNQILSFVPPDGHFKLTSYRFVLYYCYWNVSHSLYEKCNKDLQIAVLI